MSDPVEFFITESIAHARQMPTKDAVIFLRGLLQSSLESPAIDRIRAAFIALSESDRQLELIQSGQMKLDFTPSKMAKRGDGA
jgi:hypothetical protein